jgi:glycosyltransferase involved in cell wall biosynthesis
LYFADIRFPLERANGIQTFETCHALAARGHHVTLVVRDDTARPRRDPFEFYGLPRLAALRVVRLPLRGPYAARRVQFLMLAPLRASVWSRCGCAITRDLGAAAAVLRLSSAWRPPLIYESHGFAPVFSGTLPELVAGTRPGSPRKLRRLTRREQRVWRDADGYVTTTKVLASELSQRFGARERVTTISNGVRLPADRAFHLRPRGQTTVLGYAGHLYPWKGVDVFIRAVERLPDTRGIIVGGLPGEPDLDRARDLARRIGVEQRIEFTGQVEPSQVPSLLAQADVLVLPTVDTASAIYTSPLKLFEYFAAGRPVVASDLPPVREIVRDGENAVLFKPGDSESLAAAIRRVWQDEQFAERLARTAYLEASEYGWSRRAERLEAFVVSVLCAVGRPVGARA